jgi:hypothetical protein
MYFAVEKKKKKNLLGTSFLGINKTLQTDK